MWWTIRSEKRFTALLESAALGLVEEPLAIFAPVVSEGVWQWTQPMVAKVARPFSLDGVEGLPASQSRYGVWYCELPQPAHRIVRLRAALESGNSVLPAMADHTGARNAGAVGAAGETRSANVLSTRGRDDARISPG